MGTEKPAEDMRKPDGPPKFEKRAPREDNIDLSFRNQPTS